MNIQELSNAMFKWDSFMPRQKSFLCVSLRLGFISIPSITGYIRVGFVYLTNTSVFKDSKFCCQYGTTHSTYVLSSNQSQKKSILNLDRFSLKNAL